MPELLLGCGNRRDKQIHPLGRTEWTDLTTLDIDPNCKADVEHDLERLPLPFPDEKFDEIHAYHLLEHVGRQGDFRFFFAQFSDFWRLLKPEGVVCGIVPQPSTKWVFGDPGHTRVIVPEMFTFLDQGQYSEQIGRTALTDYRKYYRADFSLVFIDVQDEQMFFVLKAQKPSRISV